MGGESNNGTNIDQKTMQQIIDAVKTGGVSIFTKTTSKGNTVGFQFVNGKKVRLSEPPQRSSDTPSTDPPELRVDPDDLNPLAF